MRHWKLSPRIGESGYYVLAKFNDDQRTELELTAFQVSFFFKLV